MSIEAIRQVTETEQANKQSRAAAEAEARQLVLDAERNGTELLKQVRSDAAEQGKDLLRQAEERAALRVLVQKGKSVGIRFCFSCFHEIFTVYW